MATNRFNDIKYTYEAIEKNLQQLESQEEKVDQQRMLIQEILSKFPAEVLVKLEESKNLAENWTVKLLRESLKHYIDVYEGMSSILEVYLIEAREVVIILIRGQETL